MTRPLHDKERFTEFDQWINQHPLLQSTHTNVMDIDKVFHRFCTWSPDGGGLTRDVQAMLFLEYKQYGAEPRYSQLDSLYSSTQCLATAFAFQVQDNNGRFKAGHPHNTKRAKRMKDGKTIELKHYGCFILIMSHTTPDDSAWMDWMHLAGGGSWARRRITKEQLEGILSFQLHPVSLRADNPARAHKKRRGQHPLFESVAELT